MQMVDKVESIVPNLCDVYRYSFKSQGMKAKRDYCQLVIKREFLGETAKPKPRIFTPSASMANLALSIRSQSSTNLAIQTANLHGQQQQYSNMNSMPVSPMSPMSPMGGSGLSNTMHKGMKSARSVMDFNDIHRTNDQMLSQAMQSPLPMQPSQYVGLSPNDSIRNQNTKKPIQPDDDESIDSVNRIPLRRFQIVTVPMLHSNCTEQRGYVRAFYETYEEVREFSDGTVEWTCIHHSDFSGWVPAFMADHSIANAFPKEAEALMEYVQRSRTRPLHNEY
ncbi:hypothetical protein FB645_004306 [Coemansia sp. IMI 203386]|nr:hypothetical protein FB645_004306 [Coemansia sp. IMI 203386]